MTRFRARRLLLATALAVGAVLSTAAPAAGTPTPAPPPAGLPTAGPAAPASPSDPSEEPEPVRVVVLVDQSRTLKPEDVVAEQEAARLVVLSAPTPASSVTVIGFGSAEAGVPAVGPVCGRGGPVAEESRELLDCIGTLALREPGRGDDTDHVAALTEAKARLAGTRGPRLIVLLTDGKLDVGGNTQYSGATDEERTAAAAAQLDGLLGALREDAVQVWPLGFGTDDDLDEDRLDQYARGAAGSTCPGDAGPRRTVIRGTADLTAAVQGLYASAACLGTSPIAQEPTAPGTPLELPVEVSPIATDGTIVVFTREPGATVSFAPPTGPPVTGSGEQGGARFALTTDDAGTRALRVSPIEPGRWIVTVTTPDDARPGNALATATFKAAVRANLLPPEPQRPTPGEELTVAVRLYHPLRDIDAPDLLAGLVFTAELAGDGFEPVSVPLDDDDRDTSYTGRVTVPATATGRLTITGSVGGRGVDGDTRTLDTGIADPQAPVVAQLTAVSTADDPLHPGDAIPVELDVTARTATTLRVDVVDGSPGAVLIPEPTEVAVSAGASRHRLALRLAPDTALSTNRATVRVSDPGGEVLDAEPVTAAVEAAPSLLYRLRWWLLALAAVLVLAAALVAGRVRAARARRVLTGVRVEQLAGSYPVRALDARPGSTELRFVLHDGGDGPRLEWAGTADPDVLMLRRDPDGGFLLTPPGGEPVPLRAGARWTGPDGVVLVVHDGHDGSGADTVGPADPGDARPSYL